MTAPATIGEEAAQHRRAFSEWRPVDELILTAMAHTRSSVEEMAGRLRRSPAEVENHLNRLGLL